MAPWSPFSTEAQLSAFPYGESAETIRVARPVSSVLPAWVHEQQEEDKLLADLDELEEGLIELVRSCRSGLRENEGLQDFQRRLEDAAGQQLNTLYNVFKNMACVHDLADLKKRCITVHDRYQELKDDMFYLCSDLAAAELEIADYADIIEQMHSQIEQAAADAADMVTAAEAKSDMVCKTAVNERDEAIRQMEQQMEAAAADAAAFIAAAESQMSEVHKETAIMRDEARKQTEAAAAATAATVAAAESKSYTVCKAAADLRDEALHMAAIANADKAAMGAKVAAATLRIASMRNVPCRPSIEEAVLLAASEEATMRGHMQVRGRCLLPAAALAAVVATPALTAYLKTSCSKLRMMDNDAYRAAAAAAGDRGHDYFKMLAVLEEELDVLHRVEDMYVQLLGDENKLRRIADSWLPAA